MFWMLSVSIGRVLLDTVKFVPHHSTRYLCLRNHLLIVKEPITLKLRSMAIAYFLFFRLSPLISKIQNVGFAFIESSHFLSENFSLSPGRITISTVMLTKGYSLISSLFCCNERRRFSTPATSSENEYKFPTRNRITKQMQQR